jgi:hypothetical protein
MLAVLGRGLQSLYGDVLKEGVPEHLAEHVQRLGKRDDPDAT